MKRSIIALIIISISIVSFLAGWKTGSSGRLGVLSVYHLPGIFNSAGMTVPDGQGSAISLDAFGRAKMSTTTVININTP